MASDSRDRQKRAAAKAAVELVPQGRLIGVGTGSTANHFIDALAAVRSRIAGAVASSDETERRLATAGLPVVTLDEAGVLPLYVDGADEATRDGMLIKGGGGALTREKIVAAASERFVCIVDESKLVEGLGRFPLPVEVLPMARAHVARQLAALGGRAEERHGFVTDNGNLILDVHGLVLVDPVEIEDRIERIAGVVASGLFCRRGADLLLVGTPSAVERYT